MTQKDMLAHTFVPTNNIQLHVLQAGPEDSSLVILLHGFPEFWYGWRQQIDYLAKTGYRVWAPDQRGYNLSDKPEGIAAYNLDELARDVVGLMDAANQEKVVLVGHDWGAAVAWWVALKYPDRLSKLVILNVPHPLVMQKQLRQNRGQMLKSWYMFFFQIPWLPEKLSRFHNWQPATKALTASSRPDTFSEEDLALYRKAWSQPKAYTSMINWYRAMMQSQPVTPKSWRITVPTLLIWGAQDMFLGREMAQPSIDMCDNGRLVFIEEASHWVQHEEAAQVNELLTNFWQTETNTTAR